MIQVCSLDSRISTGSPYIRPRAYAGPILSATKSRRRLTSGDSTTSFRSHKLGMSEYTEVAAALRPLIASTQFSRDSNRILGLDQFLFLPRLALSLAGHPNT